jgi:hypothetical protein
MSQFQPVHASRHVDVREKQNNVGARLQQHNGFVGIGGLQRDEAGFFDDFDGKHPLERIIFHDQNDEPGSG